MFGYVKPRHADLLVREYDFYRATYCGVCRAMRKKTGLLSSLTLSYDIVFLALCRMLLTGEGLCCRHRRCIAHPLRPRPCLEGNEALQFAARVSAILSYEKLLDDLHDKGFGKKLRAVIALPFLRRAAKRADLPLLLDATKDALSRLSWLEQEGRASVDAPAHEFGELLGAVFAEGLDGETKDTYFAVGYHLGKFIYAADAADDAREDAKSGDYNPYLLLYGKDAFESGAPQSVYVALRLELDALGKAVERLPLAGADAVASIIKNTVYLGLADRTEALCKPHPKKQHRKEHHHDRSL